MQFCPECRKETEYSLKQIPYKKEIRDKEYEFSITGAFCKECGERINFPGLIDFNVKEVDQQYRMREQIVSQEDIQDLMVVYNIGKAPLSLALGFGEITITRYLSGQIPSREYSYVIRTALESPDYMKEKLEENREKIGETAYKKSMNAAKDLEPLFALSEKILLVISYIFKREKEVTPLALQKLLYYIQGMYMVLQHRALFSEDCRAWAHGPVYREVYEVFKSFKYNPIDDTRFAMFQNRFHELSDEERHVIDLVVDSFGIYSGKTLERITHQETPWIEARANCLPDEASNEIITKDAIKSYFSQVAEKYTLDNVTGILDYIHDQLRTVPQS